MANTASNTARKQAPLPTQAFETAGKALVCLGKRQEDDHWPSDYGGPLFLLPGLVIAYEISGTAWTDQQRKRMVTYLRSVQNDDGGWGLHTAGSSTVLGTALNYAALRLLGVEAKDKDCLRARTCLHSLGGAEGIPTWGKFWLAVLGVYSWDGINPLPPELWLMPKSLPMHPGNLWCHTRAVFLPMSYIYGHRYQGPITDKVRALRDEMFTTPFDSIDWPSQRSNIAPGDVYTPHSVGLKAFNELCAKYEKRPSKRVRKRALKWVKEVMRSEDRGSNYLTIGPVSKAIQMLAHWFDDPQGDEFRRHVERVDDYLWDGHDGLKMQGYNGSQLWDVAFAALAMLEYRAVPGVSSDDRGQTKALEQTLQGAHRFVDRNQIRENIVKHDRFYRDPTKGAWPFSTAEQGWSVSDCTAEGLKVALKMQYLAKEPISSQRMKEAVEILLWSQNPDGGWSEYEKARGTVALEYLNAAEVFGDIMIGYSYTECTSACIQGLRWFAEDHPGYRANEIEQTIEKGAKFLRARQRPDGSWYGGWGVCFTYGTWFGIEGLLAAKYSPSSEPIQEAVQFILNHQRTDGGWGEDFSSCVEHQYIQHREGQVVQTAWALLALMAGCPDPHQRPGVWEAIERGVSFIMSKQRKDGGWDREGISGVFNRNCGINYDNYRFIFPLWALSRYCRLADAESP